MNNNEVSSQETIQLRRERGRETESIILNIINVIRHCEKMKATEYLLTNIYLCYILGRHPAAYF